METIVAISTPLGRGGIGIVRLSGKPLPIAFKIFNAKSLDAKKISSHHMYFGTIKTEAFSDKGYMVYFKGPKSYTGEDIIEFHCHGGIRIMQGIVNECIKLGARPAMAGEFTRQAFLNGKMALADAEGVIDMINSDSVEAVKVAYRLMSGHLSNDIKQIQDNLADIITSLEAVLDYPEELEEELSPEYNKEIKNILYSLEKQLQHKAYGKMAKYGIDVAIVGETNVGKSSLMNAMLGENRAIVSDIKGTTRDIIKESFEYKGVKINLIDTAGIRKTVDIIEQEGVNRAKSVALSADLVIMLYDISQSENMQNIEIYNYFKDKKIIEVYNKSDLVEGKNDIFLSKNDSALVISAKNKKGIDKLLNEIAELYFGGKIEVAELMTNERHLYATQKAYDAINDAYTNLNMASIDCIILDLKNAWVALGEITGETVTEDIVDNIFNKFCVGK